MDLGTTQFELPVVKDGPPEPRRHRPVRAVVLHTVRIAMVAGVLLLIRHQHRQYLAEEAAREQEPVPIDAVQELFPNAVAGGAFDPERRTQQVVDASGEPLGYILQTSPEADDIIGFSGPTNVLIGFSPDDRIVGLQILWSRDTRDHLKLIRQDGSFLQAWNGMSWQEAARSPAVDNVSGATLTSLAIAESVARRLGGKPPSLKFPDEISLADVQKLFPGADRLDAAPLRPALLRVFDSGGVDSQTEDPGGVDPGEEDSGEEDSGEEDSGGRLLGYVFRTSPAADSIVGYQGPTDTLVALDPQQQVLGIRIRESFDNEPYVGYLREDDYFLNRFNEYSLEELAELDLFEARVEGVSGATMTSLAVADALVRAARQAREEVSPAPKTDSVPLLSPRDLTSIAVVAAGLVIGFTRLRRFRWLRLLLLISVIGVIGILNGDLVSQAIVVGWAQSGIPWKLATGLVVVSAIAFLVPALSKQQVYCHQLCPHGAVQQLLRNRLPWKPSVPRPVHRALRLVPFVLLGWCLVAGMLHLDFSLADIEPFDAWVFQAAGVATISIAVVGLTASLFVPMAYCRYGCPTGAVLDFLRFNSRSDEWSRHDWLASGLLAFAGMLSFLPPTVRIDQVRVASRVASEDTVLLPWLQNLLNWMQNNEAVMWWLAATSAVMFVGTIVAVPWLVARIPSDYFTRPADASEAFRTRHPAIAIIGRGTKNLLGVCLVLAGLIMLVVPGQGLLTILLGVMLIDFPGKRRLEILLIRRRSISRAVNWMRQRAGRESLEVPDRQEVPDHEDVTDYKGSRS